MNRGGISLSMEVMRMKNIKNTVKKQDKKTVTKGRKKSWHTPAPPMGNIQKYLIKNTIQ